MCITTSPATLARTKIFVASPAAGVQAVVYEMALAALTAAVTMVLPVPGDGVEFVSLEREPYFFSKLQSWLAPPETRTRGGKGMGEKVAVGAYDASWVTHEAAGVLPAELAVPASVLAAYPPAYSFVVFRLRDVTAEPNLRHPMAFTFRQRAFAQGKLFFPTTHLHDGGELRATDDYDHILIAQGAAGPRPAPVIETEVGLSGGEVWRRKYDAATLRRHTSRAWLTVAADGAETVVEFLTWNVSYTPPPNMPLVDAARPCILTALRGQHVNADVWVAVE